MLKSTDMAHPCAAAQWLKMAGIERVALVIKGILTHAHKGSNGSLVGGIPPALRFSWPLLTTDPPSEESLQLERISLQQPAEGCLMPERDQTARPCSQAELSCGKSGLSHATRDPICFYGLG